MVFNEPGTIFVAEYCAYNIDLFRIVHSSMAAINKGTTLTERGLLLEFMLVKLPNL